MNSQVFDYRRINQYLRIIQFSFFAASGCFFNYLLLYLDNIGFTEMQSGAVYAVGAALLVILQPLLGKFLDQTYRYKQFVCGVLLFGIIGVSIVPFLENARVAELILIIALYTLVSQLGSIYDLWTYQLKNECPEVSFGSTRALGSLGTGITTFITGYLIAWCGFWIMFVFAVLLELFTLFVSYRMPNPTRHTSPSSSPQKKAGFRIPATVIIYIASLLVFKIAIIIISTFSSLLAQRLGGGSETHGLVILLCGLTEIPTFILVGRWCQSHNVRFWYMVSLLFGLLGCLVTILAPNIPIFIGGRLILTIIYAIYTIVNLEYIRKYISPESQGRVMLLIAGLSTGASSVASSLLGGYLLERGDMALTAWLIVGIIAFSIVLSLFAFQRTKTDEPT